MDHFGIGNMLRGVANVMFMQIRGSGRTTSLVDSVKTGDRVVFTNTSHARRFEQLCKERGVKVECVVVPVDQPSRLFDRGSVPGDGRLIFDHVWLEEYYLETIKQAEACVDKWQREIGGVGAAHRETERIHRAGRMDWDHFT